MTDSFVGVGLRSAHFSYLLNRPKIAVQWFEAVSENYMDSAGRPLQVLENIRADYPVALHGVSMSVGSEDGIRPGYLARLADLVRRIDPFLVSDHLCWTGIGKANIHDLLPLPYSDEALEVAVRNISAAQEALKRTIAIENVSAYLAFPEPRYSEWEFIAAVARKAGCKILLDLNNVYVNAKNFQFDPRAYVDAIPAELVGQIHLAGHADLETHLFDTHSRPVCDEVWDLYAYAAARLPPTPVLIEWDEEVPEFGVVELEAVKARHIWDHGRKTELAAAGDH